MPSPYGGQQTSAFQSTQTSPASERVAYSQMSQPYMASASTSTIVTPALVEQVLAASSSNPEVMECLQKIQQGGDNEEYLKKLGRLIQSMQANTPPQSIPTTPIPNTPPVFVKDFDLVLEFQERTSDRWVFPRGPVFCERVAAERHTDAVANPHAFDIIVTALMPFAGAAGATSNEAISEENVVPPPPIGSQPVSFRFSGVGHGLWELLIQWVGGEQKMEENKKTLIDKVCTFAFFL